MSTFSTAIATGADDGSRSQASSFNSNGTFMTLGKSGSNLYAGFFRFISVTIPQGATINSATIDFTASSSSSTTTMDLSIYANAVDSATAPTTYSEFDALSLTTANASWVPGAWTANAFPYTTSDFKDVIQEIVNRGGWSSGNSLMIIIQNNTGTTYRQTGAYDWTGHTPATITIDYTAGSPPSSNSNFLAFF